MNEQKWNRYFLEVLKLYECVINKKQMNNFQNKGKNYICNLETE